MTSPAFHMVQFQLDMRRLTELGRMLRLPLREVDTEYLVHCALGELFQDLAPSCYWVDSTQHGSVRVLAYTALDVEGLHEVAKGLASPVVYRCAQWEACVSKPMPEVFPEGTKFGFEVRVTPTVRLASELAPMDDHHKPMRKGTEIDAYLAAQLRARDVTLDRESTYLDWLSRRLNTSQFGARLDSCAMQRFALTRVVRRHERRSTGGDSATRRAKQFTLPDATFHGVLEVEDGALFRTQLERGVGRHRAFGFGMLKLRRAGAMTTRQD